MSHKTSSAICIGTPRSALEIGQLTQLREIPTAGFRMMEVPRRPNVLKKAAYCPAFLQSGAFEKNAGPKRDFYAHFVR